MEYMNYIFFIHLSVGENLGCVHILAIVNSAAMKIGMHISLWIMVFSGYMPWSGIPGLCGNSIFKVIYETEIDPQTEKTNLWLPKGEEGER